MKVLFVIHRYWPYPGGAEKYVQEMAERLVRDGHRAAVITTDAWDIEYFHTRGRKRVDRGNESLNGVPVARLRVRKLPFHKRVSAFLSSLPSTALQAHFTRPSPFLPSLRRELDKHGDADIVHACGFPFYSLFYEGLAFANRRGIPFVATPFIHFGEPHKPSRFHALAPRILRDSDLIIVQTERERDVVREFFTDESRVAVLGMGVNPEEIIGGCGAAFRKRYRISPGDTVILHVAEKSMEKGSLHLVEALKRLRRKTPRIKAVLVGASTGEFTDYISRQGTAIRNACVFIDAVSGQDKRDMFDACDIYVMTSKTDTFGIVYLEAWLAQKPVIGAFAGGVPDVITDGVDGYLIPFGNVPMLSGYLWKLMNDAALSDRMGENGYTKVLSRHTWNRKYETFKGLITALKPGGRCLPLKLR